jgi:hypothetical protein
MSIAAYKWTRSRRKKGSTAFDAVLRSVLVLGRLLFVFATAFEAVAFAVHLKNVDVMGQTIHNAPVKRSEPKTSVHSSKGRFDVMMLEPRS